MVYHFSVDLPIFIKTAVPGRLGSSTPESHCTVVRGQPRVTGQQAAVGHTFVGPLELLRGPPEAWEGRCCSPVTRILVDDFPKHLPFVLRDLHLIDKH